MKRFLTLLSLVFILMVAFQPEVEAQTKNGISYHLIYPNFISPDNSEADFEDIFNEIDYRGVGLTYQRHIGHGFYLGFPLKMVVGATEKRPGLAENANRQNSMLSLDVLAQKYLGKESNLIRPYVHLGPSVMQNFTTEETDFNFPAGIGLAIRLGEHIFLDGYSQYRTSTNDNSGWHHGIGATLLFGGAAPVEPPPPPPPSDRDMDGVPDLTDACPDDPGSAATSGCPDKDGDGVTDAMDACPEIAGASQFDGCPDTDGDGIADPADACPNEAGELANKGCPVKDADGDGLVDDEDKCPNEAGPRSNNGCPLADRDGDGVSDADDACPDTKGDARYKGCPDTDGDGVPNNVDKCPNRAGTAANKGCPEIKAEDKAKLDNAIRNVQFNTGSSNLKTQSNAILDEVAGIVARYPEYSMTISGHTDSSGDDILNQRLSERRAKACYEYLMRKGIDGSRMSHAGYGETQPVANNTTAAGRAENRRVVFFMFVR